MSLNKKNSKIANIQFLLSIFIVFIHANTTYINLPGKELQYVFGLNVSSFIQVFISEGISRIAVPMFLCISGYLLFKTFDGSFKCYIGKLKKRFFSLVIPYLFWSAAVFFAFYFAQKTPALSSYFTTRNGGELSVKIIIEDIIISSYNSPLWFCRYLIVFAIFSICIYWIIKKAWFIALPIAFYGWFIGFPFSIGFRMDAVFFYLLGAFIAIHNNLILKIYSNIKKFEITFFVTFFILLIFNTYFFCKQQPLNVINGNYDILSVYVQKITIIFGCLAVWLGYDKIIVSNTHIWKLSQYSFLIFVCHHPVINVLKKILMKILGVTSLTSLFAYFISVILTLLAIIVFGSLIKKYCKPIWKLLTGNR